MPQTVNGTVFNQALLPKGGGRWGSFGASFTLQCIAIAAVVMAPLLAPQKLEAVKQYWVVSIGAPHIEAWKPQPKPKLALVKREVVKEIPKPEEIVPPKPKIYSPVITAPVAKRHVARKIDTPDVAKVFPDPTPSISMGSSAIPNLKKPREAVQTGGFGDPNGVADNGKRDRNPNINAVGSYDLPNGPGYGNGTGGAKGARGVIPSTGFGNGVAIGSAGSAGHGSVQQGVFADEQATAGPRVKQVAAVINTTPVEILFKPKPQYTDEARAKKVEGEVLLRVLFTASGEVQVQGVVRGLGYGLDDSAISAARQIRFRPAQQEGQPVDKSAIVHIAFELAD